MTTRAGGQARTWVQSYLSFTLGAVVAARLVEPFQRCVVLGLDAGLDLQQKVAGGGLGDGECLGLQLVISR